MSKVMDARYDAKQNVFRLAEKPEDIPDDAEVTLSARVKTLPVRSVVEFRGRLSKEAGDSLADAIEEMFPPWESC
ncbi:MAG TPA: hypothetical protein VM733_04560 [Thermoanaerobaculia bacterium]|nr:hypothetical protein [Thermoanaerobaculia bacterium]